MTHEQSDGSADSWTSGGAAALAMYAPEALTAFGLLVSVRPLGVHDEVLESAPVAAFADRFATLLAGEAAGIDDEVREQFRQATGEHAGAVVDMVWIADVAPRIRAALDALFGASDEWPGRRRYPVADTQVAIRGFREAVSRLDLLEPAASEESRAAALALTEAVHDTPTVVPAATVAAVHRSLTPAQAVAVVLAAASGSAERIDAALR